MVTSINLGNISNQGGRNVVGGGASGIDTEALIKGLAEARRLPAVTLEARIETNATITESYKKLQTILTKFRDAANFLRNPPGVNNADDNIFQYRKSSVSGSGSQAGSNFLSVTAEPGASISDYKVSVDKLATQSVKITETFALVNPDTAVVGAGKPFSAGTLALGPDGIEVEFEDGETLNQIVAKINSVKGQSDVEASIIRVADGQYRLSLKTLSTGDAANWQLGTPTPPDFIINDAVFRLDANDINGNEIADNPVADQVVAAPVDGSGTTTIASSGVAPTLDVDGINGIAAFDFSLGNGGYIPASNATITSAASYQQKTFSFSFQTGASVAGTQTIYEQGSNARGFGLHIAPDPANGNQPTLFAVAYNTNQWTAGSQLKTLNLGVVTPNTEMNVTLSFDASANPTVNDPANTFTGFVNGTQVAQVTGVRQQGSHPSIGVGFSTGGVRLANNTTTNTNTNYFQGKISEINQFNRVLTNSEMTELNNYMSARYQEPIATSNVFNVGFAVVEDAVDAELTIDGTTVTRPTNSFDDVIEGITFNLLEETTVGEELNVSIDADTELAKAAIFTFVDAYNEFRIFAAEQTATNEDGTPTDSAILSGSSTLRTVTSRVNTEIAMIIGGLTAGAPDRLADIGLSFDDFDGDEETPFVRNILTVDEAKLDSALASDFNAVRKVFEFDFTTDDPNLTVFSRTNGLDVTSMDLNIDQTNGIYEATYLNELGNSVTVTLDSSSLTGGGVVLTGKVGTLIEGLTLIYASNDDATVGLDLSQGIGDRIFNTIDEILDEDEGLLSTELESISSTNTRLQKEIDNIDTKVERYREQLIQQYAALEAALASANTILQSINANNNARNAAGN